MMTAGEGFGMETARWTSVLGLALLLALPCGGQNASSGGKSSMSSMNTQTVNLDGSPAGDVRNPLFEEKRLRQLSIAQHKSMVNDTSKLLKLVTELNAEISSTNPSSLTPDELRKIAEIEKLAHSVKDKMRISLKSGPVFLEMPPIVVR
jgi:hypothetical protein